MGRCLMKTASTQEPNRLTEKGLSPNIKQIKAYVLNKDYTKIDLYSIFPFLIFRKCRFNKR